MSSSAWAQTRTYTTDADFDEGLLLNVNHDAPNNDQLQLNEGTAAFPFINVAASSRGTVVRANTETGEIVGEFYSSPSGMGRNPSRTTVDQLGNVWVGNRNESGFIDGVRKGSYTRIGLIVGGTRTDASGTPDPSGQYLQGPFDYNTCVDRDGDGLIRTSTGLGNILPWTNAGGVDTEGGVTTADDECIINYTRAASPGARTVAIDANNDVWVGGTSFPRVHEKIDGVTGQVIPGTAFEPRNLSGGTTCGGYGGFIDGNGILWSMTSGSTYLRFDTNTMTGDCLPLVNYGTGVDPNTGEIWITQLSGNTVHKVASDGTLLGSFSHGNNNAQGVAVDTDGNVWVAHSLFSATTVGHLKTDGTYIGNVTLPGGNGPTGISIDADGKVWVANINSNNAMRIDPDAGPIGADGVTPVGAVDLTVDLGAGARPYNYSDMTGSVVASTTAPQGNWTVVYDGGAPDVVWQTLSWNSDEPAGTSITGKVRAANAQVDLASQPFTTVSNGADFVADGIQGRFVEIQMTLTRSGSAPSSPILFDATISALSAACLASDFDEVFNNADRRVEITIEDPEGIETANFTDPSGNPYLVNLSVQLIEASNSGGNVGFSRDNMGSDIDWSADDPSDLPTRVVMYLNQVDSNDPNAGYFLITENSCGTETVIDPPHDFGLREVLAFALESSYPNPTRGAATVSFTLEETAPVQLSVFDVMGRKVATLVDQSMQAGRHDVRWNGRSADGGAVASGVYLIRLEAGNRVATRRITVVK